eukprot:TRINITY_DN52_c0_g2_i11.p1 TRINITY_DN52_c0_g2~~TRINITY_DN52_c0_g2_i11.p1  ORF type:complete len:422 (-),score=10.86 TRINITY_DN52_c0_g2_i11:60-1325(-)
MDTTPTHVLSETDALGERDVQAEASSEKSKSSKRIRGPKPPTGLTQNIGKHAFLLPSNLFENFLSILTLGVNCISVTQSSKIGFRRYNPVEITLLFSYLGLLHYVKTSQMYSLKTSQFSFTAAFEDLFRDAINIKIPDFISGFFRSLCIAEVNESNVIGPNFPDFPGLNKAGYLSDPLLQCIFPDLYGLRRAANAIREKISDAGVQRFPKWDNNLVTSSPQVEPNFAVYQANAWMRPGLMTSYHIDLETYKAVSQSEFHVPPPPPDPTDVNSWEEYLGLNDHALHAWIRSMIPCLHMLEQLYPCSSSCNDFSSFNGNTPAYKTFHEKHHGSLLHQNRLPGLPPRSSSIHATFTRNLIDAQLAVTFGIVAHYDKSLMHPDANQDLITQGPYWKAPITYTTPMQNIDIALSKMLSPMMQFRKT